MDENTLPRTHPSRGPGVGGPGNGLDAVQPNPQGPDAGVAPPGDLGAVHFDLRRFPTTPPGEAEAPATGLMLGTPAPAQIVADADRQEYTEDLEYSSAHAAVRALLRYIGEDPNKHGIRDTPERFLKAWRESWGAGYQAQPPKLTMFPEPGVDYNQMVIVKGMAFYSTCEHHLAPFFGRVSIAYIPHAKRGILGISKLARVVEYYSRRLQVQERLTAQIANHLVEYVADDVGVLMEATHTCMVSRGVQQPNAITTTSAMRGDFLNDPATRSEFLRLTKA